MNIQNEFSSFRILLKQVYSAHTTKVKELEGELKTLKEKLIEKESEVNNVSTDCKRCVELEEAFKSCKKSLNEQSKWFESFGQKFSIFSCSEVGGQDFKNSIKISNSVPETIIKGTIQNKSESSMLTLGDDTLTENKISDADKIPNKNLLKNVMLDNGSLESFDVLTVTFPEIVKHGNPSAKYDSMILAPDSLDVSLESSKANPPKFHKNKAVSNSNQGEKLRDERNPEIKTSGKRLSTEALDDSRVKRHNAGSHVDKASKITNRTDVKFPDCLVPEIVVSNNVPNLSKHVEAKPKIALKDFVVTNDYRPKKHNSGIQVESGSTITKTTTPDCLKPEIVISSDLPNISKHVEGKTKTSSKDLSVQNVQMPKKKYSGAKTDSRDNVIETPKSSVNNIANDFKKKSSPYEVSPSLLPTNVNALPKIIDLESATNDNDDFQDLVPSSKSVQIEDSWETCDKKKSIRKNKTAKTIKTASKYKMTLVAPPLNHKKPNYKQTKLSKSLFKAKVNSNKNIPEKSVSKNNDEDDNDDDIVLSEDDSVPTFLPGHCQTSTQCFRPKSLCTFDIDATFIPENFRMESPDCITSSVKKQSVEKSHFKNGGLFSSISFPEELKSAAKEEESCENEIGKFHEKIEQSSFKDTDLKENINSFDRLPVPEEPNFKYKNDVVRKKSERRHLTAFDCKECEKYYSDLGLSEKEKKERMKKCSRHRAKFTPPSTPDHFWELDFPDTQECKARGYMNETLKVKLNNIGNI